MLDNYGTHKHPTVRAWLEKNPRVQLNFTPTSGSWLNMVEIFLGTRQAIRRGTFASLKDLVAGIRRLIEGSNERWEPFVWSIRTYPCRAAAARATCAFLKAIRPLASCSKARWFSAFFDQRMSRARLRLSHEWQASTTHRLARQPGV